MRGVLCFCPKCPAPKNLLGRVVRKYGRVCYLCNISIADTVDHVIPKSKGGDNSINNLRPACQKCNNEKSNKSLPQFLKQKYGVEIKQTHVVAIR